MIRNKPFFIFFHGTARKGLKLRLALGELYDGGKTKNKKNEK